MTNGAWHVRPHPLVHLTRVACAFLAVATLLAQTPTQPKKEYIYIGGRLVVIEQPGPQCTIAVSPTSSPVIAYNDVSNRDITVIAPAGCAWTAAANQSWVILNSSSGMGDGTVTYHPTTNPDPQQRNATITVSLSAPASGNATYSVVQAAAPASCTFTTSPAPGETVSSAAGTRSVTVTTGSSCTWNVTVNSQAAGWLHPPTTSVTGSGSFNYSFDPNNSGATRTGTLTIGGSSTTFVVTQPPASCTYTPSPASPYILTSNSAGNYTVTVTTGTGCTVTASSNTSWITNVTVSGTTVSFTVSQNLGIFRTGTMTIAGQTYTVTQPGSIGAGVFAGGMWAIDGNKNGVPEDCSVEHCIGFGMPGDIPVYGDWNGDGKTKAGVFRNGVFLLDYNGNGVFDWCTTDRCIPWGEPGDIPVVGNWNGLNEVSQGRLYTKVGIYRGGTWVFDWNGDGFFDYGAEGEGEDGIHILGWGNFWGDNAEIPVVGHWDGGTVDRIGVFHNGFFMLMRQYSVATFWWGQSGDLPVIADWNGVGTSKVGIFRSGLWLVDYNGNQIGEACDAVDRCFGWGGSGHTPVVGKW
jgi:hypothetical protein